MTVQKRMGNPTRSWRGPIDITDWTKKGACIIPDTAKRGGVVPDTAKRGAVVPDTAKRGAVVPDTAKRGADILVRAEIGAADRAKRGADIPNRAMRNADIATRAVRSANIPPRAMKGAIPIKELFVSRTTSISWSRPWNNAVPQLWRNPTTMAPIAWQSATWAITKISRNTASSGYA